MRRGVEPIAKDRVTRRQSECDSSEEGSRSRTSDSDASELFFHQATSVFRRAYGT